MNRTKIPWVKNPDGSQGYTFNPLKGLCPMHCKSPSGYEYCYSSGERGFYHRFDWNPEFRLDEELLVKASQELNGAGKARGVFICSTSEWLWNRKWAEVVYNFCVMHKRHRFYLLTKLPERLKTFSLFPENCYVGITATENKSFRRALIGFAQIEAAVTFLSIEPFYGHIFFTQHTYHPLPNVGWVILGSQTQPVKHPDKLWVDDFLDAAGRAHIPVFVKEPLASHYGINRMELPQLEVSV